MLHKDLVRTHKICAHSARSPRDIPVENVAIWAALPAVATHLVAKIENRHPNLRCTIVDDLQNGCGGFLPDSTVLIVDMNCGDGTAPSYPGSVDRLATKVIQCGGSPVAGHLPPNPRLLHLGQPDTDRLMDVLTAVVTGQAVSTEISLPDRCKTETEIKVAPKPVFTKRESEVYDGILKGHRYKQIAASLGLSEATVKVHAYRIFDKTGIHSKHRLASMHLGHC